jgi:hypothetical protein
MRDRSILPTFAFAVAALTVSACSTSSHGSAFVPGATPALSARGFAGDAAPACPAKGGAVIKQKYGASKFTFYQVRAGGLVHIAWRIDYTNLPSDAYPHFWFDRSQPLAACYANARPVGDLDGRGVRTGGGYFDIDGVRTADQWIEFYYKAPPVVKGAFKYVMIRMVPEPPTLGYGPVPAALIQINP